MNNKKTNTLSVVGFITSFFTIIISSIICFIALAQIKERHERGKGLAYTGIVLNLLKITAFIIVIILLMTLPVRSETEYKCKHSKFCTINKDGNSFTCTYNTDGVEEYVTCSINLIEGEKTIENYGADDDNQDTFDYDREY